MSHGSYYYPQAVLLLRVRLEDFGNKASGVSDEWHNMTCLARSVTVKINEYSKADEFSADIDYNNFPFDPRAIRACGVSICMQDMGKLYDRDNSIERIVPSEENLVFVGFADEESISFSDSDKTVSITGRDMTSLLIDRKFLEGNIDVDKPLDVVIRSLLDKLEESRTLKLDVRVQEELPVLAKFWSDKGGLSGKKNVPKDRSYWDVIQSMVGDAAMIAYIELDKLVLTKPRVLFDRNQAKVFAWGSMIDDLEFKRKIGRKKGFNIAVKCMNLESKEVLEALIPKEATDEWSKETGIANTEVKIPKMAPVMPTEAKEGEKPENPISDQQADKEGTPAPYMRFNVANVSSKKQLIEIGQGIYEEISRQQIDGSFTTREMQFRYKKVNSAAFETFNILKLRVGTPIMIELSENEREIGAGGDVATIREMLLKRNHDRRIANTLAQSIGRANTPFYTKSVEFKLDSETGFEASIEFINFIETKAV